MPLHKVPVGQMLPHAPQLALSFCRLAQYFGPVAGEHNVLPVSQPSVQMLFTQCVPFKHGIMQPPQLLSSLVVLTQ
jgi:hypothetical protein